MKKLTALIIALLFAVPSIAAPVSITSDVWVLRNRVDAGGKAITVLEKPAFLVPGDLLLFELKAVNSGGNVEEPVVITNPIPATVEYLSANDSPTFSVDGGRGWGVLADLTIKMADGQYRLASPSDVTHLRWSISKMAAGETVKRSFRGRVR